MQFSDFKRVKDVLEKYPLATKKEIFLRDVVIELPEWFIDKLHFALTRQSEIEHEMFFRELFIGPFMEQAWMLHPKLKLWINQNLAYQDELTGAPDYFVAQQVEGVTQNLIGKPLLAVAEAKQEDFIQGWGQCLAEMIACQKLNGDENIVIYGIVSTGEVWQFAKLVGDTFSKNLFSYSIREPNHVFGALEFIFSECEKQVVAEAT